MRTKSALGTGTSLTRGLTGRLCGGIGRLNGLEHVLPMVPPIDDVKTGLMFFVGADHPNPLNRSSQRPRRGSAASPIAVLQPYIQCVNYVAAPFIAEVGR